MCRILVSGNQSGGVPERALLKAEVPSHRVRGWWSATGSGLLILTLGSPTLCPESRDAVLPALSSPFDLAFLEIPALEPALELLRRESAQFEAVLDVPVRFVSASQPSRNAWVVNSDTTAEQTSLTWDRTHSRLVSTIAAASDFGASLNLLSSLASEPEATQVLDDDADEWADVFDRVGAVDLAVINSLGRACSALSSNSEPCPFGYSHRAKRLVADKF